MTYQEQLRHIIKKLVVPEEMVKILIVYRINGKPVHPAHGGPFSVYFPVVSNPHLAERFPDSAALFFLKEIVVK